MKKVYIFLLSALFFAPAFGQNNAKFSPFTRAILNTQTDTVLRQKSPLKNLLKNSEGNFQTIKAFIEISENADLQAIENLGVKINSVVGTILTAEIPVTQLENLAALPDVKRIEAGVPVNKRMDVARAVANVDSVHQGFVNMTQYKGKDVVVGVVDMGFEYGHINFYDKTGAELRVKRVWNQNNDKKYETAEQILTAGRDTQNETHATHVSGIAAGAYKMNGFRCYGVAPDADLVFVSVGKDDGTNLEIADGIKYVFDYAAEAGKPAVVNASLGTHIGPHDGTSIFDRYCETLVGAGKIFVGAAGNEGNDLVHVSKKIETTADTLKTFLDISINSYYGGGGSADFWGEAGKSYKMQIVEYDRTNNSVVNSSQIFNISANNQFSKQFNSGGTSGQVYIYTQRDNTNNKANALVMAGFQNIASNHFIGLKIFSDEVCAVDGWCEIGFKANGVSGWISGNGNSSVGEIGGSGKRTISVGAFNSKTSFTNLDGNTLRSGETAGTLASFSSRGPMPDGRVKPDITAPGQFVVSSFSGANSIINSEYKYYLTNKETFNGKSYYFASMQGTSMSSPFVAGVIALWLQMKPDLTPEEVKEIFAHTSIKDKHTGEISENGSNLWGFGKINALDGLRYIKATYGAKEPELEKDKPYFLYTANIQNDEKFTIIFPREAENIRVKFYSVDGKLIFEKQFNIGVSSLETISFSYNLPRGLYFGLIYYTEIDNEGNKVEKAAGDKIIY